MNFEILDKYRFPDIEYLLNRGNLVIELNKVIYPILNEIHILDLSERFWLRMLRNHLRRSINRFHLLKSSSYQPRKSFIDLPDDGYFPVQLNTLLKLNAAFLVKSFRNNVDLSYVNSKLSKHDSIAIGIEAEILSKENQSFVLQEYFPKPVHFSFLKRKLLKQIASNQSDLFIKNVLLSMPFYLVEMFEHNYKSIPVISNSSNKIFHRGHISSFFSELIIAKYQENGARVYQYQTGCGHGEREYIPDETVYQTIDKHITYGWKRNHKDTPGRAHRIEWFAEKFAQEREEDSMVQFDCILVLSESNKELRKHYKIFTEYFQQHIDPLKYQNILIRPRPRSKKINNSSEVAYIDLKEQIKVDDGKQPMYKATAKSQLNILLYTPATNFYECIIVNQPVVAFNMFRHPSKLFKPFLDFFKEVGIVHDTVESLVNHLNTVDLVKWWYDVCNDKRFDEFARLFAGKK